MRSRARLATSRERLDRGSRGRTRNDGRGLSGLGVFGRGRRSPWRSTSRLGRMLTPARAGAVLGILVATLGIDGLITARAFDIKGVDVAPTRWTPREELLRWLDVPDGVNAFLLPTGSLGARLEQLPAIAAASVNVALPDRLVVRVTERDPILAWRVGSATYLVDREGYLFAMVAPSAVATAHIPTVLDSRATSRVVLTLGAHVEPVDLDVATRLGSLTPDDVGSGAKGLQVRISDGQGYVVSATPRSWTAVFGFYSPVLRTPDLIPGQVRLLRSLLFGQETRVARVILADDHNGTFVPLPSSR